MVRSGSWVGATGKALKDVVAMCIGGSFLGPLFVHTALQTECGNSHCKLLQKRILNGSGHHCPNYGFNRYHLTAIKELSPFNDFLFGEKFKLFHEKSTGTQIYIWNLDDWGLDYCSEWKTRNKDKSSSDVGDIGIRSRNIRPREGQVYREVLLDYSLRSYLEVFLLDQQMNIFLQGSLVKSHSLTKSLVNPIFFNGNVMGKPVLLTFGLCQLEFEHRNIGIFLY
ncbi:hypothetical protein GIB67_039483 [Kingdonia uniflora]|uniref:Uncharacterized protein n=1 Tax=Kingdonia uniflora TaxID=39325 RepID=A0A7J7LIY1_9MAGN|nr:hypothetical protein GIB67_039483 [Kingdonia uniflora]